MKKKRIVISLALTGAVLMSQAVIPTMVHASEFEGEESYWSQLCSQAQADPETVTKCNEYISYMKSRKEEKLSEASKAQSDMDSMKGDIDDLAKKSFMYSQQLETINTDKKDAEDVVEKTNMSLSALDSEIASQSKKVDDITEVVLERMVDLQVIINTNKYVSIVMGSSDLVSFIQKSKSVGTFTDNDNKMINTLTEEIQKLENQKSEQGRIKGMQDMQLASIQELEEQSKVVSKQNDEVYAQLVEESKNLATVRDNAEAEGEIIGGLTPSVSPIPYIPPKPTPKPDPKPNENNGTETTNNGNESVPEGNESGNENSGNGQTTWGTAQVNFYSGWYDSSKNVFSPTYTGQCTWFVYGRANEKSGGAYTNLPTGHAGNWVYTAQQRGFSTGNTPRSNSIAVWGNASYGHVAYIESFDGETVRVTEGNVNAPGGGLPIGTSLQTAIQYTTDTTISYNTYISYRGYPIGFIYL